MSLKITSAVRQGSVGCGHYLVTVNDNGTTRSKLFSIDQMNTLFSQFDDFPGGARGALILAWIKDRRDRGATLAQLVNVEIESVIS